MVDVEVHEMILAEVTSCQKTKSFGFISLDAAEIWCGVQNQEHGWIGVMIGGESGYAFLQAIKKRKLS